MYKLEHTKAKPLVHAFIDANAGYDAWGAISVGDFDGDGRLLVFHPSDPVSGEMWPPNVLASQLIGDGTVAGAVRNPNAQTLDLISNGGWWENVNGDGSIWIPRPLLPANWDFHPETRIALGDVYGNGSTCLVVTESEIPDARMTVLPCNGLNKSWEAEEIIHSHEGICAMHSLQLADVDGDGVLEIVSKVWRANAINGAQGNNHVDHGVFR